MKNLLTTGIVILSDSKGSLSLTATFASILYAARKRSRADDNNYHDFCNINFSTELRKGVIDEIL
jgi:hypothetical protein